MSGRRLGAGDLRDRVAIERPEETPDAQGGRTVTYVPLATVWAHVLPWETQPAETIQRGATTGSTQYRVTIGYRPDVTARCRIRWTPYGGAAARILEVSAVSPVAGERRFLRCDCVERV